MPNKIPPPPLLLPLFNARGGSGRHWQQQIPFRKVEDFNGGGGGGGEVAIKS